MCAYKTIYFIIDYYDTTLEPCSVMFRRLDCLRRTQRVYSSNVSSHVFGRESFACRHIGPDNNEQEQMLKELGYQVLFNYSVMCASKYFDLVARTLER